MNTKLFFLVTLLAILCICSIAFAQEPPTPTHEEITLTTYYPAPYGEYNSLAVGDPTAGYTATTPGELLVEDKVGIGTAPDIVRAKLDVRDGHVQVLSEGTGNYGLLLYKYSSDAAFYRGVIDFMRARGSMALPAAVSAGDYIMSIEGVGFDGSIWDYAGGIHMKSAGVSGGVVESEIHFDTANQAVGTGRTVMTINKDGNLGIGTTGPVLKLDIDGGVYLRSDAQTQRTYFPPLSSQDGDGIYFRSDSSFSNQGANAGVFLKRLAFNDAPGTANDITEKVGLWLGGFHDNSGTGVPIYLGGFLYNADTPAVTIQSGGNVGIGTTEPVAKLHVYSAPYNTMLYGGNITVRRDKSYIDGNSALGCIDFRGTETGGGAVNERGALIYVMGDGTWSADDSPGRLEFRTTPDGSDTAQTRMVIKNTGNIGIGTTSPAVPLDVVSQRSGAGATDTMRWSAPNKGGNVSHVHWDTYGDWYIRPAHNSGHVYVKNYQAESDISKKKAIEDLSYGLSSVMELHPIMFRWKGETEDSQKTIGLIAQEVEPVIPELVSGEEGNKAIGDITAVLVKAIQEQQQEINKLKLEVKDLEAKLR